MTAASVSLAWLDMILTIGQQVLKPSDSQRREERFRLVGTVGYHQVGEIWQVADDVRQHLEMPTRGEKNTACRQIDHPAQRGSTKGAIHRHFDKIELFQRI